MHGVGERRRVRARSRRGAIRAMLLSMTVLLAVANNICPRLTLPRPGTGTTSSKFFSLGNQADEDRSSSRKDLRPLEWYAALHFPSHRALSYASAHPKPLARRV